MVSHCKSPNDKRRGEGKEVVGGGGAAVNSILRVCGFSLAKSSPGKKRSLLPNGLCYHHEA